MAPAIEPAIDPLVPPSGTGCVECLATTDQWWLHLRRCTACGHIGCCDSSPNQHATAHWNASGHPIIQSFEPGEDWFWDYTTEGYATGPRLCDPQCYPDDQPVPAPADRIPADWESRLH